MIPHMKKMYVLYLSVIALLVFLPELVLLEVKYSQIRGGFLQAYQFDGVSEISCYMFSLALVFTLFTACMFFASRALFRILFGLNTLFVFHFTAIFSSLYAITLLMKYQLHVYFSDAMDLVVISRIAGDLKTALTYVLQEGVIFIVVISICIVTYYLLFRVLKKHQKNTGIYFAYSRKSLGPVLRDMVAVLLICSLLASFLAVLIEDPKLDYALRRQVSGKMSLVILGKVADFDGDGFSLYSRKKDPNPFDSHVYPGAIDIPDNGEDENGLGGEFSLVKTKETAMRKYFSGQIKKPENLVLIVMESARGDIIGKRINGELVAPNLTELAEKGSNIENAYSHTGYTSSSLNTLFSGSFSKKNHPNSLYRQFYKQGFDVSVISGQDETWGDLDSQLGSREVAKFFYDPQDDPEERVFSSKLPSSIKLSEDSLFEAFEKNILYKKWEAPQFIYFNFQAGHFPYFHKNMPRKFVDEGIPRGKINPDSKDWLAATYWNSMHHADVYIGKIIDALRHKGVLDETMIIVLGDHGESLFDDGFLGHGHYINDS